MSVISLTDFAATKGYAHAEQLLGHHLVEAFRSNSPTNFAKDLVAGFYIYGEGAARRILGVPKIPSAMPFTFGFPVLTSGCGAPMVIMVADVPTTYLGVNLDDFLEQDEKRIDLLSRIYELDGGLSSSWISAPTNFLIDAILALETLPSQDDLAIRRMLNERKAVHDVWQQEADAYLQEFGNIFEISKTAK